MSDRYIRKAASILNVSYDYLKNGFPFDIPNTPAKRIKDAILRLGYKQKDFADNTGIYYTTLSRYLTEKTSIPEDYIHRASEALDLPYEYIKYGNPEGVSLPSYGAKEDTRYKEIINRLENIEQLLNILLEQK